MSDLKILDFAVIFRNVIDLGKPAWKDREDILREIKPVVAEENEIFKAINQVSDTVCSLSKRQMLRFELPEIEVVDIPKVYFFSDSDVVKAFQKHDKHTIQVYPSFHRSGTLTCNFHFRVEHESSVEEAIHSIRINLRTLIIKLPSEFIPYKDHFLCKDDKTRIIATDEGDFYLVATLKNYTSNVIRPLLRHLWQKTIQSDVSLYRCVSSTLVQIYQTNPSYPSLDPLIQNYASELHAIGTMHKTYQKSDTANENFINNLSSDEELGVFTFGLSDLIVFDNTYKEVTKALQERKKLKDFYSAVVYNTTHYGVLLEWLYLEKFIIDRYNRLLSRAIADENTSPSQMLSLQKQSMQDLIMYTAGITPFPSREEFLEKARLAHRVPELQEKIEKKRDLATDYVIQEYTLRTNKAIQLVNIFVSATAAFGLMEVILSISQQQTSKVFWGGITAAMFIGVLVFLSVSSKIVLSKSRR